jgi:hypothetical protein
MVSENLQYSIGKFKKPDHIAHALFAMMGVNSRIFGSH